MFRPDLPPLDTTQTLESVEVSKGWTMTRRLTWTLGNFGLEAFESVQQVAQLERTRFHKSSGKTQHETRYFISNTDSDKFSKVIYESTTSLEGPG